MAKPIKRLMNTRLQHIIHDLYQIKIFLETWVCCTWMALPCDYLDKKKKSGISVSGLQCQMFGEAHLSGTGFLLPPQAPCSLEHLCSSDFLPVCGLPISGCGFWVCPLLSALLWFLLYIFSRGKSFLLVFRSQLLSKQLAFWCPHRRRWAQGLPPLPSWPRSEGHLSGVWPRSLCSNFSAWPICLPSL